MIKKINILIFICVFFPSCEKKVEIQQVFLPPTHVLSMNANWGVIKSSHLRLREEASIDSSLKTTFWNRRNVVLEIISQTNKKEKIEDKYDYWYQVSYDGLIGWVFGGYIDLYNSRDEAIRMARELN